MGNSIKKIVLSVLVICAFAGAAVIFEDDFTNPGISNGKWLSNIDNNMVTVAGGELTINNTSQYTGTYHHPFNGTKPDIFTLSFVMKSAPTNNGDAGMLFCSNPDALSGYYITFFGNDIGVFSYPEGGNSILYVSSSSAVNMNGNNKITVSKSGSTFNVFVNDVFQGYFTDSKHTSGDISFCVDDGKSAVFGPVSMTNQFTESPTSLSDNFSGSNLKYWNQFPDGATIKEESGKLKISTGTTSSPLMFVNLNLTDFETSVEVSHRSGDKSALYGIALVGKIPTGGGYSYSTLYFTINGDRYWCILRNDGNSVTLAKNLAIGGSEFQGEFYVDTLKVVKKSGSSKYEFSVNGTVLSDTNLVLGFDIIGVGLFCKNNLNLEFDNFYAAQDKATSITWKPNQHLTNRSKYLTKNSGKIYYDLMGRKRFSVEQPLSKGVQTRAAGMYLNEQGREIRVRKTPQK